MDRRLRGDMAAGQHAVGLIQFGLNRLDEARSALEKARSLREELAQEAPEDARSRADLAATMIAMGRLEWKAGRLAEAERLWREAEDRWSRAEAQAPASGRDPGRSGRRRAGRSATNTAGSGSGPWPRPYSSRLEAGPIDSPRTVFCSAMLSLAAGDEAAYRGLCARILDLTSRSRARRPPSRSWVGPSSWRRAGSPSRLARLALLNPDKPSPFVSGEPRRGAGALPVRPVRGGGPAPPRGDDGQGDERRTTGVDESLLAMACIASAARMRPAGAGGRRGDPGAHRTGRCSIGTERFRGQWWDWAAGLALRREAERTIRGKAGPDPPLATLAAARLYAKLGRTDLAEDGFRAAVEAAPGDPEVWLSRAEVLAKLGHRDRADADLARAAALTPADPMPWVRHGRRLAERGDRAGADTAFARAAGATPDELNRFFEAGWWVVGPYPESLTTPCPPEIDPDPARPVASADGAAAPTWRSIATGEYGRVDLRAVFNADHISAYALTYVYSPDERTATLMVGGDDRVRVWLNGRSVHETIRSNDDWSNIDHVPVTLRAGRNTLLVKVSQGDGPHSLVLRLADNPLDRAERFVAMGLWRRGRGAVRWGCGEGRRKTWCCTYRYAALLWAAGRADRCRRVAEAVFERHRSVSDSGVAHAVAMVCDLAPEARVDFARLAELDEQCADFGKRRDGNTNDLSLGRTDLPPRRPVRARAGPRPRIPQGRIHGSRRCWP